MFRFLAQWFGIQSSESGAMSHPMVNIDGTPMHGPVDIYGRPYGVVDNRSTMELGCEDLLSQSTSGVSWSTDPWSHDNFGSMGSHDSFGSCGGHDSFGGGFGSD